MTLALLWKECRGHHPDGYGYGRFCDLYVEWRHGITATMRQAHAAGEKLFVDFGGDTVPVFDGLTRRSAPPRRPVSHTIGRIVDRTIRRRSLIVCTENLIRVDDVMESPKLAE